jgi:EAL domain-containing protein (putative c-di-GMP-specific phosphodiesterase class I)
VNLITGAIAGAEALLRWAHPTQGPIAPALFIPVAEECGLILPIGRWVLREACTQARIWIEMALPVTSMPVNVTAMEFRSKDFLDGLFAILLETDSIQAFLRWS